jgi:hypothetical protein
MSDQVVLLWKARWLNETWTLSRALRRQDRLSRRVFAVCQAAISGVPGHAPWDVAEVTLGYSRRSVRRRVRAGKLGGVWQGYFALGALLHSPRGRLRTTLLPAPDDVDWWGYVPLLMERSLVPGWMAWHAWGRLSLPDLSARSHEGGAQSRAGGAWHLRFVGPPPTPGRDIPGRVSQDAAQIMQAWQADPVAVRAGPSDSGRFATTLFDGADLARLEWNRWVLGLRDDAERAGVAPFSEGHPISQNGAALGGE